MSLNTQINNSFDRSIELTEDQQIKTRRVRLAMLNVALGLDSTLVDGREKSLAITKLEEALLWTEKSILLNS